MKGWIRPWRGLNLSLENRVPDARVVIWDGRSRWARDRIHEWWRLLVGAEVEVAARQQTTYEMGPWDLRGRVVEAWAQGGHLRLVLQPGGEVEVEAQRIDLDLRLGVLRARTRVGRILWVRRLGILWQQSPYHGWEQGLVRAYSLVLRSRIVYDLEATSWSSYLHSVVFAPHQERRFCGWSELEITLPAAGRSEVGETDFYFLSPLLWPVVLTGLTTVVWLKTKHLHQLRGSQKLFLRPWQSVFYALDGEVSVYSFVTVLLDKPWRIASPFAVSLFYTSPKAGQRLNGIAVEVHTKVASGVGLSPRLRHWQGIWPIYSREPVLANLFRSRLLRHGL